MEQNGGNGKAMVVNEMGVEFDQPVQSSIEPYLLANDGLTRK